MIHYETKILSPVALQHKLNFWRFKSYKVVFTNGCFDILHPGHLHILSQAHDLGDILIVGLNSDRSVNNLKGPNRPILDQHARGLILASLAFVDAVVIFDEPTPLELINTIRPDILVKGGDYKAEDIVGYKEMQTWGGMVAVAPFLPGYSTTSIEDRIRNS